MISKPSACHSRTATSFDLTTKLNCIDLNPSRRASSSENSAIVRPTRLPLASGATMYPALQTCAPKPGWLAFKKNVPTISPFGLCRSPLKRPARFGSSVQTATYVHFSGAYQKASISSFEESGGKVYVSPVESTALIICQTSSMSSSVAFLISNISLQSKFPNHPVLRFVENILSLTDAPETHKLPFADFQFVKKRNAML